MNLVNSLDSEVDALANSFNISTSTVSDAGWGLSYGNNLIMKTGKVVFLTIQATRSGGDLPDNNYSLFTIPSGYRINGYVNYFNARLYKSNYVNEFKDVSVEVYNNGSVKLGYGFTTSGYNSIMISIAYPLA